MFSLSYVIARCDKGLGRSFAFSAFNLAILVFTSMIPHVKLTHYYIKPKANTENNDIIKLLFFSILFVARYSILTQEIFQFSRNVSIKYQLD